MYEYLSWNEPSNSLERNYQHEATDTDGVLIDKGFTWAFFTGS